MKLKWTRVALQDMHHLHDYIAEDNIAAANQMAARIREATEHLKKHPQMGRAGRVKGTRELIIAGSPYIVVYILEKSEIQIVAIIHNAMRWPDSFN